jgi:translation elongation factor EF-G
MNSLAPAVIEVAVEPRSRADLERLERALPDLKARDPSLRISMDPPSTFRR